MKSIWRIKSIVCASTSTTRGSRKVRLPLLETGYGLLAAMLALTVPAGAQVNVLTAHNDIARTGQNLNETILTPTNVSANTFGKLFSQPTTGAVIAEPLYVANLAIPGKGTHNVVYVASTSYVYAFDADDNGGVNATPLWSTKLPTSAPGPNSGGIQQGVIGTPVIDPPSSSDPSGTIYLVSTIGYDNGGGDSAGFGFQLHALDITTGLEKFNGPVTIQATVAGNGNGSTGGELPFRNYAQQQRPGLLLLNGVVYIGFGSVGDDGSWHGWIYSYNSSTLALIDVLCLSPQGFGAGLWAGGAALAAEVNDPAKPYGRMFIATGNGTYSAPGAPPYPRGKDYAMSVIDLDLTGGKMTIEDLFTPYDYSSLEVQDADIGSGAPVLLPSQTLANGTTLQPLVEIAKSGMVYILNRNNLGGYNNVAGATHDNVQQEFQTPEVGAENWGAGVWGTESYWNGNIYYGGQNSGQPHALTAYSFVNGVMSAQPTSQTARNFWYPSPTTSVSANGNTNGILWVLHSDDSQANYQMLQAYDATNLGKLLYSSETNFARDNPGVNSKFSTPMIANGKVYVTSASGLSVYGLLNSVKTTATPSISPDGGTFTGSVQVSITDSTPNSQIYYTTDGSTPSSASTLYTGPFTITASETITAIASATGYNQSAPAAATFSAHGITANPVLSLAAGTYTGSQKVSMSDSTNGAIIYYTLDGTTPTTTSNVYSTNILVPVSETVNAIAVAPGLQTSAVVSYSYVISVPNTINFPQGFAEAQSGNQVQFNGDTDLDDVRLQLTNGGLFEASSAFFTTPVNIQAFTTDFTFQLSNPVADGITFTIQNAGVGALGANGSALGYGGIGKSVAIKFDLHNNAGEGNDSTGLYVNGALPTVPAIDLTNTGINLHDDAVMYAHITYDGVNLTMTLTDGVTLATWSYSWPINIPATVGGNTAYVGFTGGSGGSSSSQKIESWTYLAGTPPVPNYPAGFDAAGLTLNGAALAGNLLQITSGGTYQFHSAYYSTQVDIDAFTTSFDFQMKQAAADGFTFIIQDTSPQAVGDSGIGSGLGYQNIHLSAAIKFDIHNNAGEGNDSTGFYVEGAAPTVPAIDLTNTGLVLGNGDSYHVVITYNGTTLTWTISDNTKPALPSVTNQVTVNLASILDSNVGWVGFTGASGSTSAVQNILDWTFTQ